MLEVKFSNSVDVPGGMSNLVGLGHEAVNLEGRTVKQNKPVVIRKTREIDNIYVWVNQKLGRCYILAKLGFGVSPVNWR